MLAKLVILADPGLLKAYKLTRPPGGSPHLDLVEQVVLEGAYRRLVEAVTDLAGKRATPTPRKQNLHAPLACPQRMQPHQGRRLSREIARHVERLARAHHELGLCLAAPKEINPAIVQALPGKVRSRIKANLSCDLVRAEREQIIGSFAPEARLNRAKETSRFSEAA